MDADVEEAKKKSFILVEFDEYGSGVPHVYFNQVNAFQIMGLAHVLEVYGKNMLLRELAEATQKQAEAQVAVVKPVILRPK